VDGHVGSVGLPDLLRLHCDVVRLEQATLSADDAAIRGLMQRLDAAVDAVVAELDRGRR